MRQGRKIYHLSKRGEVDVHDDHHIAIIGYAASVPGADTPNAFTKMTQAGLCGLSSASEDELSKHLPSSIKNDPNFRAIGGGPTHYKNFDASFFGISPKEALLMCPQIRKSLEYAWLAIEHAGYAPNKMTGLTSAFVSSSLNAYFIENLRVRFDKASDTEKTQMIFLNEPDFLASRLAYYFDWHGAAFNIKCGCSSSLVAVHEACSALMQMDCDTALVGGVSIKPRYQYGYIYEQDGILSKSGYCSPFSKDADGTVFANGLGFVVLKRLQDAIDAGDTIHAVIVGSAINNDGREKVGYMAPSVSGQANVISEALALAELEPSEVSYVEAHGTGTAIGDPIEYQGLLQNFGDCASKSIALRSVKANVGHMDAASGVVGLIKVIEDLKHQAISPNLNFSSVSDKLAYDKKSPFAFNNEKTAWTTVNNKPRVAAISSFGIGGTNANVLLKEGIVSDGDDKNNSGAYHILLSAKTKRGLLASVAKLTSELTLTSSIQLGNLAYTLALGRTPFKYRVAIKASEVAELITKLNAVQEADVISTQESEEIIVTASDLLAGSNLAKAYLSGARICNLNEPLEGYSRVSLNTTVFEATEYWVYPQEVNEALEDSAQEKCLDVNQWFYMPYWKREELRMAQHDLKGKTVLLLSQDDGVMRALKTTAEAKGANVLCVSSGDAFVVQGDKKFIVNASDANDYIQLLKNLYKQEQYPDRVVHGWTIGCEEDFQVNQTLGLYALVNLLQASQKIYGDVPFKLAILSDGLANISGMEVVQPSKATMLGIAQVLQKEHEKASCHLICFDINDAPELVAQGVWNEFNLEHSTEIALRSTRRFVKEYSRTELKPDNLGDISIHKKKAYLVIGGLGNFGIELSEFIGAHHGGSVYLTTRMKFPEKAKWTDWLSSNPKGSISEKITKLLELEKQGANVEVLTMDVTDIESMHVVKAMIEAKHGKLSGVVHAAGIVDSGMIQHKTIQSLEEVFQAKVHGTYHVAQVFLNHDLDFLILCSSMNSIIGGLGQIDNTAANAFVDAYAEYCCLQGYRNVLAINWGAVNEARARNYSALPQFSELSREHIKNKMTLDEIFQVYQRLFSTNLGPRVVVSTLNFNQVIENWSRVGSLSSLIENRVQAVQKRQDLTDSTFIAPESQLECWVATLWQNLLGFDAISMEDDFFDLGGNSLVALQLISEITKEYAIKMHAMSIYEYPSLGEFSVYVSRLVQEVKDKKELAA